jgi:Cysteine-rich CPXCG
VRKKKQAAAAVVCPFCGEAEELFVDMGGGEHQSYIEDCAVCCRPRVVTVSPGDSDGEVLVSLDRGE